jgi:1-acyl-sn-glycerol-3-phosphate acyltransferase/2-polyprenyl-3-methyl-5-hydroxy-6-metoxy-1,4-benzoquinol methylase
MSESLKKAEKHLDEISRGGLKDVYIVATGKSLNNALELNDISQKKLEMLKGQGIIHDYSGISTMFLSDSIQNERLHRWNEFWTMERKVKLLNLLENKGKQSGFNETAFSGINSTLNTSYLPITKGESKKLITVFFSDWINETPEMKMVSGIAKVTEREKQSVYKAFSGNPNVVVFDRQNLTTQFVLTVKRDFELLITLSMVFVTLLLLISFGRIELTIITSLPMYFSWLITLGFMGVTGIKFNIFNIIISTFIFGLGVDYSILMMRGLLSQYKTGINDLKTYQVSILLSSATTIIGVGVLFIAKHPALNSIALISIVGIVSVVLISLSYQSMITRWLMLRPQERGIAPKTAYTILHSIFITWLPLSLILIFLVVYSHILNYLVPVSKKLKKDHFLRICHFLSRFYIRMCLSLHLDNENQISEEFLKPAIILGSYQSILDIPIILGLHRKIILVAKDRIMHHWLFGSVARLAGIIPCPISLTDSVTLMKQQTELGYSLLIFPEMLTSKDRNIEQVNKEVVNIAQLFKLDIVPVLIFGSSDRLSKGSFWGRPNRIFIKILPGISETDPKLDGNFSERPETIQSYYHHEFLKFKDRNNTPAYNASKLMLNYIFKGPIPEWYIRVKLKLEKDFSSYCTLLPQAGEILDLGCGYGYISYMLKLTSDKRIITGIDYDEKKISIARHGYLKDSRISFIAADVMDYKITSKDGFLFGDVLHYLSFGNQEALLTRCIKNLNPGGVILIRDGNADNEARHKGTRFTEFLSISVFRFNKKHEKSSQLYFTSASRLLSIAEKFGLTFEIIDQKKITSNTFFIMRMPLNPNNISSLT